MATCQQGSGWRQVTASDTWWTSDSQLVIVDIMVHENTHHVRPLPFRETSLRDQAPRIRMEVASSRPDHLPTLSVAKTSKHSLLVKHHTLAIDEASWQQQQQPSTQLLYHHVTSWSSRLRMPNNNYINSIDIEHSQVSA